MSGLPPPFISDMVLNISKKTMSRWEGKLGKYYTLEEISKHNTPDDFWVIVRGKVYDLTDYLMLHPGGPKLLFKNAGRDTTEDFEAMFHSRNAKAILEKFWIGTVLQQPKSSSLLSPNSNFKIPISKSSLKSPSNSSNSSNSPNTIIVDQQQPQQQQQQPNESIVKSPIILSKVKINKKTKHTENTYHYSIELPENHLHLNWVTPLSHVSLSKHQENEDQLDFKSYTPIKQSEDKKHLEFLIKGYENGNVSKHIHNLNEGDYLSLNGPIETKDSFSFENYKKDYLLLIAGGTGITPMLQIILETFYKNKNDKLKFILIYSSNNQNEIIYKNELDQIKSEFKDRLFIHYILTQPKTDNTDMVIDGISIKKGRINQDLILTCLEPIIIKTIPKMITDSMDCLVCGPIDFNNFQNNELLKIGFKSDQIHLLQ